MCKDTFNPYFSTYFYKIVLDACIHCSRPNVFVTDSLKSLKQIQEENTSVTLKMLVEVISSSASGNWKEDLIGAFESPGKFRNLAVGRKFMNKLNCQLLPVFPVSSCLIVVLSLL